MDESLSRFITLIHEVLDRIAPFRDIKVKQKTKPWFNSDIQAEIRRRETLFHEYCKDRGKEEIYREYCRIRNKVQRDVKKAKEFYFRDQVVRNRDDSGKLWSHLKTLGYGASRKGNGMTVLMDDGDRCYDNKTVAGVFNRFFTSVASDLVSKLSAPSRLFSHTSRVVRQFYTQKGLVEGSFSLSPVSRQLGMIF